MRTNLTCQEKPTFCTQTGQNALAPMAPPPTSLVAYRVSSSQFSPDLNTYPRLRVSELHSTTTGWLKKK